MILSIKVVLLVLFSKCKAIKINKLDVPQIVNTHVDSLILDCDYSLEDISRNIKDSGLVVKWFFNGRNLVYQWIPPLQPQVIGILKGKTEKWFKITEDPLRAHRAIKVLRLSTELSGNYTCVVSTFLEEDRRTKSMLVYSSGKNFHFVQKKKYVFLVTLICVAEDLYPKPEMIILSQGELPLKQTVTEFNMSSWGLYTVTATAEVHDDNVTDPYEEFVCVLRLPTADYEENRTTVYYRGLMPTSNELSGEGFKRAQKVHSNGCQTIQKPINTYLYLILIWWYKSW